MSARGGWFLLAATLAALPARAIRADDTHYATPLLGDRPTGMGSAATGVASEASAAYYNPGGLTRMQRSSISGGLWLRAYDRVEVENALRSGTSTSDFSDTSTPGIPGFAAASIPIGRRHANGERSVVIAASTFQIYASRREGDLSIAEPNVRADSATLATSDRATLYGLSAAFLAPRRLSFGLSLFLERRRLREEGAVTSLTYGSDTVGPVYDDALLSTTERRLNVNAYDFVIRLGVHQRPTRRFAWGLMFQPPGIKLKATGSIRDLAAVNDARVSPPRASYALRDESGLNAYMPIPFEIRMGVAYQLSSHVLLASDLSIVGPVANRPIVNSSLPVLPPLDGPAYFIASSRKRTTVVNLALGTELAPKGKLIVRLGFLTDFSAAPHIPATSTSYYAPHVNLYGFSSSLGLRTWGKDNWGRGISCGFVAMFGRGTAMSAVLDSPTAPFQRSSAIERTFFVTITGGFATAEQLAQRSAARVSH